MIDEQRAAFEAWAVGKAELHKMESGEYSARPTRLARDAWQAALASPEVQALREDAERYRKLRVMATQQADSLGPIFRIDVRRTPKTLFNFDAAIDAAMEKQK